MTQLQPEPSHLSALDLDRLILGRSGHPHLDACDACRSRRDALQDLQAAFIDTRALHRGLQRMEAGRPKPVQRWAWLLAPMAAACALLLYMQQRGPGTDDVLVKGDAVASMYVYRGDTWQPVSKGQALKAGEGVRVQLHLQGGEAYALIAENAESALLPFGGRAATAVQKEASDALFVLDDAEGNERWLVVLSAEQVTLAQSKAAFTSLAACPKGARCTWLEFTKAANAGEKK